MTGPPTLERILVLDADSNAGLAVVQSLGAAGYACIAAATDDRAPAFASRWARETALYPDPLQDADAFKRWVKGWLREHPVALAIPCTERTLTPLHELRDDPEVVARVAMASQGALDVLLDKERLRARAAELGVSVPASLHVTRLAELDRAEIGQWLAEGAAVVKTVRSKAWTGVRAHEYPTVVVHDRVELRRAVEERIRHVAVQVQQWVPGHGLAVMLLARHGELVMSVAQERLHEVPLTGGGSSYRRTIAMPPELLADSALLMKALDYHGVAMVEFRGDPTTGRHWLMEINPRFWGSLPLAVFAGADFPRALVTMLLHDELPLAPPPRAGVYARHLQRDVRWLRLILQRGSRRSPYELHRPLAASLLEWGRIFTGRESWDGARLDDPRPILREFRQLVTREARTVVGKARKLAIQRAAQRSSITRARRYAGARRILILCHGNICRSPYAHARLASIDGGVRELRSMGFYPKPDRCTPDDFLEVADRRGIDLHAHRSRMVTHEDLAWAELIVLMDQRNYDHLRDIHRPSLAKAIWLGAFDGAGVEIADPFGERPEVIDHCLARIDRCVESLAQGHP